MSLFLSPKCANKLAFCKLYLFHDSLVKDNFCSILTIVTF